MSTQNIIDSQNLPTSTVLAHSLASGAVELMNHIRFEIGCVSHNEMRELLRLQRLICNDPCYIDSKEDRLIREDLISTGIRTIQEF